MSSAKGPPPDLPGFTFSKGIGGGGFADVFLYTQHSTGRSVAVKVLRSEHMSDLSLDQFKTEANVMAGVSAHPYIVTIHDAGVAPDGRPYIVMEHYPQQHFGLRASGGHLGMAEVLKVAVQVSAAVETAHRSRILHRDIKPANVLTSAYGDPGLSDFGIAGVQQEDGFTVATGVSLGYAAPEVVLDETATGSVASDVYSLGATIYTLLSGRSPFYVPGGDNSGAALTARITGTSPLPLNRPDVPRQLAHLLDAALSSNPSDRPESAAALGRAIQEVEQSLRLAPTQLVLLGQTTANVTPVDRTGDDEGTRRKPQVVDLDGLIPRAKFTKHQPDVSVPDVTPHPVGHLPNFSGEPARPVDSPSDESATRRRSATISDHGTVARAKAPTKAGTSGPAPVDAPATRPRPRWLKPVAGVAAVVVLAIGVMLALDGGGDDQASPTSSTIRRSEPQSPIGASFVDAPDDVRVVLNPDGSATVTWAPPPNVDDPRSITYRVQLANHPDESFGTDLTPVKAQQLVIPKTRVTAGAKGTTYCVDVFAIEGDVISDPPAQACST